MSSTHDNQFFNKQAKHKTLSSLLTVVFGEEFGLVATRNKMGSSEVSLKPRSKKMSLLKKENPVWYDKICVRIVKRFTYGCKKTSLQDRGEHSPVGAFYARLKEPIYKSQGTNQYWWHVMESKPRTSSWTRALDYKKAWKFATDPSNVYISQLDSAIKCAR